MKVRLIQDSIIKRYPAPAFALKEEFTRPASKGEVFEVNPKERESHYKSNDNWFIYIGHCEIIQDNDVYSIASEIIKEFEGFEAKAYLDPVGIPTLGYGSIRHPDGRPVRLSDTITEQKALEYLILHVKETEKPLKGNPVWNNLTANQKAALLSFIYNVGYNAFINSTLWKKITRAQGGNLSEPEIRHEFSRWNKAGGRVLAGLTRRRKAEADLFFS